MVKGKVWKFRDDVDTDQIIPSQYLLLPTIEEMKQYAFEPLDKHFSQMVGNGDIIVGGENFGSGSSREQAPRVLKALGVSAIVAKSFARIFFRNSINIGLPVLVSKELFNDVEYGDIIQIDVNKGIINNCKNQKNYNTTKLNEHVMRILDSNGLIELLNQNR